MLKSYDYVVRISMGLIVGVAVLAFCAAAYHAATRMHVMSGRAYLRSYYGKCDPDGYVCLPAELKPPIGLMLRTGVKWLDDDGKVVGQGAYFSVDGGEWAYQEQSPDPKPSL